MPWWVLSLNPLRPRVRAHDQSVHPRRGMGVARPLLGRERCPLITRDRVRDPRLARGAKAREAARATGAAWAGFAPGSSRGGPVPTSTATPCSRAVAPQSAVPDRQPHLGCSSSALLSGRHCGVYESVVYGVTMDGPNLTIIVNALSVTIGLMFLSVTAPLALRGARARELDVLMCHAALDAIDRAGQVVGNVPDRAAAGDPPRAGTFVFAIAAPDRPTWPGTPWANRPQIHELTTSDRLAAFGLPVAWILVHGMMITSVGWPRDLDQAAAWRCP